jgi:hypothetical protein
MNMQKQIKKLGLFSTALVLLSFVSVCAQADGYSVIRKMMVDTLQLEVNVQNTQGKPLAGVVVWYFENPADRGLNLEATIRMMHRYANQSDFFDVLDFLVERTNDNGYFYDYREFSGKNRLPYILVATKRGYLPQVIEGAAPLNRKHLVQFKLAPDPQAQVDPRMETFDQIMAQARNSSPEEDYMGEARMHKLEQLEQQLRKLAQDLEKDGRNNDASAIYWALADFPSVTRMTTADGQQKIIGYANGREGPAAEADRLKATQLNNSSPKLMMGKMMLQQGFPRVGIETEAHGKAYLAAFEQLANSSEKDHILPSSYRTAIYQAIQWSTPDKACELINKAYVFEPAAMPLKDWWARLKDVERQQQRLNLPPNTCEIKGLSPFKKPS